jgi:transposase
MKVLNTKTVKNIDQEVQNIIENETLSKSSKIKNLFDLGLEIKDISELLGIRYNFSYNVISNYVITNDIEVVKEERESKKDKVIELHVKGLTNIQISKELKTNYNYIYKIIKEYKMGQEKEKEVK